MLCNISQNAMRQPGGGGYRGPGTPPGGGGVPRSGYPPGGGVPRSGYPPPPGGGRGCRGPVPPGGGGCRGPGTPPGGGYPGRTTEGVLTTRRAVCLLRSRRRTFLLKHWFYKVRTNRDIIKSLESLYFLKATCILLLDFIGSFSQLKLWYSRIIQNVTG